MYHEENIPGRGIGCVADITIRKGSLILREQPCLLMQGDGSYLDRVSKAFLAMPQELQVEYLKLANKYNITESYWSDYSREFLKLRNHEMRSFNLTKIDRETLTKVWQILETNSFNNGVCLKISRLNHACRANAEYFWNRDTGTRDVRSIRKIEAGEEILLNYRGLGTLTREERRTYLEKYHHFECLCAACDVDEVQVENENRNCAHFRELELRRKKAEASQTEKKFCLKKNREEIDCLKQMYRLAREMKIFRVDTVLKNIVEEGFNAACQGFYNSRFESNSRVEELRANLLKEAHSFAEAGFQLATMVFGKEHSITRLTWHQRRKDPIACFEREND